MTGSIGNFIKNNLFKTDERKSLGIAYFFLMGIIFHALRFTRPLMMIITPYVLLVVGGYVFYRTLRGAGSRFIYWSVATYLITFAIEAVGVRTGLVFGGYSYGNVLGPKLFDTPLIIGFNWLLVIIALSMLAGRIVKNPLLGALLVGAGAFVFDFLLEPVAIQLGYWTWVKVAVPLQNYIAWFIIAFLAGLSFRLLKINPEGKLIMYYLGIQTGFFIILRFFI